MARIRAHWPVGVLLSAILASRVWFALTFPVAQISDYHAYYEEARGFAGLGPPSPNAMYAIGPKLFYAVPFRVFGDDLRVIGLVNAFTYTAAVAVLFLAASRVFGRRTALITVAVCLISVSELYFNNLASTETLATLLINVVFYLLALGLESWRSVAALGVAGGLAIYNRSNMLPIGALVFAQQWLCGRTPDRAFARGAAVQALALAITLPLCVFNLRHFGRFTPVIANAQTLWYGNNPKAGAFHAYTLIPEELPPGSEERHRLAESFASFYLNPNPDQEVTQMGPYDVGDLKVRYAAGFIRKHPRLFLALIWTRVQLYFFSCTYGEVPYRLYDRSAGIQPHWGKGHARLMERARMPVRRLYQVLMVGAAAGVLLVIARYGPRCFLATSLALPLLIVAFYAVPFLLTVAANRYHIPILGLCWTYLAHGVAMVGSRERAPVAVVRPVGGAGSAA